MTDGMHSRQYRCLDIHRDGGLLELRLHSDGGSFLWDGDSAGELCDALGDIARDPEVRVLIMTGTGDAFCRMGMKLDPLPVFDARGWEEIRRHGERLLSNLLAIEAPVIACINGPVTVHAEIPLLSDVVLAADDSEVHDEGHFLVNVVPGDGLHVFMPLLMGLTRARYFLFTGQKLTATEARDIGLINEILPREALLPRAREIARTMLQRNPLVLRYTRMLLVHHVKKLTHDLLGYGGVLEGLAIIDQGQQQSRGPAS